VNLLVLEYTAMGLEWNDAGIAVHHEWREEAQLACDEEERECLLEKVSQYWMQGISLLETMEAEKDFSLLALMS
jgi:hypothetical protein